MKQLQLAYDQLKDSYQNLENENKSLIEQSNKLRQKAHTKNEPKKKKELKDTKLTIKKYNN